MESILQERKLFFFCFFFGIIFSVIYMERKVALVTGSSRGIGKGCILEFAKRGYDVVINYNNSEELAFTLKDEVELEKVLIGG